MTPRQLLAMMKIKLRYGRDVKHLYSDQGRVSVEFTYAPVSQLKSLRGLRLHHLGLYGTKVDDWRELADLDFRSLNVGGTSFDDLAPLSGKPLVSLEVYRTRVASLEAVRGMPLSFLQIGETPIRDFALISGLPLDRLFMLYCETDDLSFLEGLNLSLFGFTFKPDTRGIECLRCMPALKKIHTTEYDSFGPEEFWHRWERGLPLDEKRNAYRAGDP